MSVVKIRLISPRTQKTMKVLCIPIMIALVGILTRLYFVFEHTGAKNSPSLKALTTILFCPLGIFLAVLFGYYGLFDEYFKQSEFDRKDHPALWMFFCGGLLLIFMVLVTATDRMIWPS